MPTPPEPGNGSMIHFHRGTMNEWYAAQIPKTRRKISPNVLPISPLAILKFSSTSKNRFIRSLLLRLISKQKPKYPVATQESGNRLWRQCADGESRVQEGDGRNSQRDMRRKEERLVNHFDYSRAGRVQGIVCFNTQRSVPRLRMIFYILRDDC